MAKVFTDLKLGKTLALDNGRLRITLHEKSGRVARLCIEAPHQLIIGDRDPSVKLPAPRRKVA